MVKHEFFGIQKSPENIFQYLLPAGASLVKRLGQIRPLLIWAEVWDGWEGAPGSAATHAGILEMGYEQIAESSPDRLYFYRGAR